jgi:hypothetical protein
VRTRFLRDTGVPENKIHENLKRVRGTLFASNTPLVTLQAVAGRHQRQQGETREANTGDLLGFLTRRIRTLTAEKGITHYGPDELFSAVIASGVKLMDVGTTAEQKARSPEQQAAMLLKQVPHTVSVLKSFPPYVS